MIPLVILAAATSMAATPTPACPGDTTQEINSCASQRLDRAGATLARYVAAARKRIEDEKDAKSAATLIAFDKAEAAWAAYATAECDAVYDDWIDGTIRDSMDLNCQIDLTTSHTHTIWSNWLTYMDDTPPILPEPSTAPDS